MAAQVVRDAALNEHGVEALFLKFALTPRARKITAIVVSAVQVDDECASKRSRGENHG
jgi:hypothetical protein